MQINNISNVSFQKAVRVFSNTQHSGNRKPSPVTEKILGTYDSFPTLYQNKEVSKKVGDFLRAQLGVHPEYKSCVVDCFNPNECYYFAGRDARRVKDFKLNAKKEIDQAYLKYGLDKTHLDDLDEKTQKAYKDEIASIQAKRDEKILRLVDNKSQLILDVDETTGDINSISYLTLVPVEEGVISEKAPHKWVVSTLDKKDIYSTEALDEN